MDNKLFLTSFPGEIEIKKRNRRSHSWQGSGEAGVKLPNWVTEKVYKASLSKGQLYEVVSHLVDVYGIPMPIVKTFGNRKKVWGTTKRLPDKGTSRINLYVPYFGTLLHEFTHHYVNQTQPGAKVHGKIFHKSLEMMWRTKGVNECLNSH